MRVIPVILCGGSGTRLWPLSRREHPKQFVPLIDGESLLAKTIDRARVWAKDSPIVCIGSEAHRFMIKEALCGVSSRIILEPEPRNTAAALAIAALDVADQDPDAVIIAMPADHHIETPGALNATMARAIEEAREDCLVVIGVEPHGPSSNYGYILPQAAEADGGSEVEAFLEKPDTSNAARLIDRGALWNSGFVIGQAQTIVASLEILAPDILNRCRAALDQGSARHDAIVLNAEHFAACPALPFDRAVLEKSDRCKVIPYYGEWSDVGSWDEIGKLTPADQGGNRIDGDAMIDGSSDVFIRSHDRLVVAIGLKGTVIVDTPDALLVADRNRLSELREVVTDLEERGRPEVKNHRRVARPWGAYERLAEGARYQVKRITVAPGAQLSLQYHYHRAEHWVVVRGTAKVTHNGKTFLLRENESTYIPIGDTHRLENPGKEVLELIEVQSGSYLEEDDIVRLEDHYGRTA